MSDTIPAPPPVTVNTTDDGPPIGSVIVIDGVFYRCPGVVEGEGLWLAPTGPWVLCTCARNVSITVMHLPPSFPPN